MWLRRHSACLACTGPWIGPQDCIKSGMVTNACQLSIQKVMTAGPAAKGYLLLYSKFEAAVSNKKKIIRKKPIHLEGWHVMSERTYGGKLEVPIKWFLNRNSSLAEEVTSRDYRGRQYRLDSRSSGFKVTIFPLNHVIFPFVFMGITLTNCHLAQQIRRNIRSRQGQFGSDRRGY